MFVFCYVFCFAFAFVFVLFFVFSSFFFACLFFSDNTLKSLLTVVISVWGGVDSFRFCVLKRKRTIVSAKLIKNKRIFYYSFYHPFLSIIVENYISSSDYEWPPLNGRYNDKHYLKVSVLLHHWKTSWGTLGM